VNRFEFLIHKTSNIFFNFDIAKFFKKVISKSSNLGHQFKGNNVILRGLARENNKIAIFQADKKAENMSEMLLL